MGDQPKAIRQLVEGVRNGQRAQVLQGVTGSGKTFTVANVIQELQRPSLVLSHNKTLAAQLYGEFRQFFPNNAVEYFVSYYDYYQPEAYIAATNTYIEKDLAINDELDKLRLRASSALLSGRRDVIVVSSVSCNLSFFSTTSCEVPVRAERNRAVVSMAAVSVGEPLTTLFLAATSLALASSWAFWAFTASKSTFGRLSSGW